MLPAVSDQLSSAHGTPTAAQIAEAVRAGQTAPGELTDAALASAKREQARLNAFITITEELAAEAAGRVAAEPTGPLAGVPVVLKDNLCLEGAPTTAGSRLLETFVPPYTATVVERLLEAGAVPVAKANLDEFGMGSTNENSAYGPVANPHDHERVAGGSSGGSAAAVAAGVVPLALGSDTGGSVRLPAAFCGIVGFKPTYGALSRYGLISYASSLDQVGIMARDVEDVRLAFEVMRGADERDATSFGERGTPDTHSPAHSGQGTSAPSGGRPRRVGVVTELSGDGVSADARAGLERAVNALREDGVEVVEVSLDSVRHAVAAYYLIATAEASSNLARYDGTIYGARAAVDQSGDAGQEAVMIATRGALFGSEVRRRILMGSFALSAGYYDAYYGRAQKVRRLVADDLADALEGVDALLSPTATCTAYRRGEKLTDPVAMYVGDVGTCLANLAGMPAISLPAGRGEDGMPVGVQLMGRVAGDDDLLALAARLHGQLA